MHAGVAGSGTLAVDFYRQSKGDQAMNVLLAGKGMNCGSSAHLSAGELCIEVIARLGSDNSQHASDNSKRDTANKAVDALKRGDGHHKAQGDHTGSNTCAAVIASATN